MKMQPTESGIVRTLFLLLILIGCSTQVIVAQVPKKKSGVQPIKAKTVSSIAVSLNKLLQQPSDTYVITAAHTSSTSGIHHVYLRQAIGGIGIRGTESDVHLAANGAILAEHNNFKEIEGQQPIQNPQLTAAQAIQTTAQKMKYTLTDLQQKERNGGASQKAVYTATGSVRGDIPVHLVYQWKGKELVLAWEFAMDDIHTPEEWWNFQVDAATGEIISKQNYVTQCNVGHKHDEAVVPTGKLSPSVHQNIPVYQPAMEAVAGSYTVFEMPVESPNFGVRTVVTNPDQNGTGSPYGWHDTDGAPGADFTVTRGNNVDAFGFTTGNRPNGGASLTFNFPLDLSQSALSQENAALTNLFYWNNMMHDVMYEYGFDEASGNFQENNYGNGGAGGDSVNAEGQKTGDCNAYFGTPTDGTNPTMQMFICQYGGTIGDRDGDLDSGVMAHEYGHGISNRLTGGAGNSNCLNNQEQMGEGWSDFFSLIMTIEPGDAGTDSRGMGTWLIGENATGGGIRTQPYDTNDNTYTYDSIKSEVAPHGVGSVWAMMLWEMTWDLIAVHGIDTNIYNFTGDNNQDAGNIQALALVIEGMKLQPCSPGFVDGRDAILAADQVLYSGANQCVIWEAFARRGLGMLADQGSTDSKSDGTQHFGLVGLELSTIEVCQPAGIVANITGGLSPNGGVYSGPGVTDDGNGTTFTFDPDAAGIGVHTITFTESCQGTSATGTIEVTDGNPVLVCQDTTVTLDGSGQASINQVDVVSNLLPAGYAEETIPFDPVTNTGTTVNLADDNGSSSLPIGFDFNFYGTDFSTFYIASNGWISFTGNGMTGGSSRAPTLLPNTSVPNGIIAGVWDDLNPGFSGTIRYQTVGTAPNRKLLVDFDEVIHWNAPSITVTFQIQLHESTNRIEFHYTEVISDGGTRTAGIENIDGTEGLPLTGKNRQAWSATNEAYAIFQQTADLADNCGNPVNLSLSQTDFTCKDIGTNTIIITADDGNGGIATCEAIVTVVGPTTTYTGSWDNGTPDSDKKAIFHTNYDTATADIDVCSCEIGNNAQVTVAAGDYMKVKGNITVQPGASLVVAHEGSLVQVDDNALVTNNGTITVEKTSPMIGDRGFMIVSSPMTQATQTAFGNPIQFRNHSTANFIPNQDVEDAFPDANNFADDNGDNWQAYNGIMTPAEGYLMMPQTTPTIGSPASYDFAFDQGTLNNGEILFTGGFNGTQNASPNMIGNPYASAIDADLFFDENPIVNEVYFWEHINAPSNTYPGYNTNNYDMGDISIYSESLGGLPAANGGATPSRYMASGQGFAVKPTGAGMLVFKNSMRLTDNNNTFRQTNSEKDRIWLNVFNETYKLGSTILIGYTEETTNGYDSEAEVKRLPTPVSFYSELATGEQLAIQGRAPFQMEDEVLLSFTTQIEEMQLYTISIHDIEGINIRKAVVFLLDTQTGSVTNLSKEDYGFSSGAGTYSHRFVLQYRESEILSTPESSLAAISIFPNPAQQALYIASPNTGITAIALYDIRGRKVFSQPIPNQTTASLEVSKLDSAMYFIAIYTDDGVVTKRFLKE